MTFTKKGALGEPKLPILEFQAEFEQGSQLVAHNWSYIEALNL